MHKIHLTISNSSTQTSHSLQSSLSNTQVFNSHDRIKSRRTFEEHLDLEAQGKQTTQLCYQYLKDNNHLGLALIARQRGIPPALRYKVWPVLLKYHPYVIAPYINATVENDSDIEIDEARIYKDILKYFRVRTSDHSNGTSSGGNSPSSKDAFISPMEQEIVRILQASIVKFFKKWGGIVKYNSAFAWISLNLAEWLPPIPNSNYVLIGKSHGSKSNPSNSHLIQIAEFENHNFSLDDSSSSASETSSCSTQNNMTFSEVFERLVLVLLHSKEKTENCHSILDSLKEQNNGLLLTLSKLNTGEILFKSGKPEHQISLFLNILSKLLPELYKSLSEDDILGNNKNNQWLTWWLKYGGAKVLNKFDRGRIWDLLLGFRLNYQDFTEEYKSNPKALKAFKRFYSVEDDDITFMSFDTDPFWYRTLDNSTSLKWSQCDYRYQLIFLFIAILHKNESNLLELDQSEIIELLNNLNFKKSFEDTRFDWMDNEFIQKAINEAGESWRFWIWREIRDEIIE